MNDSSSRRTAWRQFTLLAALAPFAASFADAPAYVPAAAQSSLTFVGTQQGEKFTGRFKDFDARGADAPDQLATSAISATIRNKSIDSNSPDRDSALVGSDWFDAAKYPVATFKAAGIRMTPTGPVGDAELTIRAKTQKFAFPFTWKSEGGKAILDAKVALDRIEYGVGTGEWADEGIAGHKVEVLVHLVLVPVPAPAAKH